MTMLADLLRDFRYAGRSLLRTPGFTVVAAGPCEDRISILLSMIDTYGSG